jgi:VWFA-related protein
MMPHTRLRVLAVSAFALWPIAAPPAQTPPPQPPPAQQPALTFRAGTDIVEVDTIVTDRRGQFVRDLTRADFEVTEDGKPQTVSTFSLVDIPILRADRPLYRTPVESEVASNERPFDGRLYLIVLDALHIEPGRTAELRKWARRFVDQFVAANDLAAVVHIGQTDAGQEFTANKRLLMASIDRFVGRKLPTATSNRIQDYMTQKSLRGGTPPTTTEDAEEMERSSRAATVLRSLETLSEYLRGLRGRRKALLYFSEGIDYDTTNIIGDATSERITRSTASRDAGSLIADTRAMIGAASRGNISFYGIDPRGQTDLGDDLIKAQTSMPDTKLQLGMEALRAEIRRGQSSLRTYAGETGGLAVVGTNDFDKGFRSIVDDNSSYYVLGYEPANRARDGGFRQITVRVKRPGLEIRARRGYYAARDEAGAGRPGDPPDPMVELLSSPAPLDGLRFKVAADAMRGTGPKPRVHFTVEIAADQVPLAEKGGAGLNEVELIYRAIDAAGKVHASTRRTAELTLLPAMRKAIEQFGYRFEAAVDVPPGRYQLRIAAREKNSGRLGSVFTDLDVPDFASDPLVMGDVVIGAQSASRSLSLTSEDESLRNVLPLPPTTQRTFAATDTLAVFAEIVDNESRLHTVDIAASIRTDDGREVYTTRDERDSREVSGSDRTYRFLGMIPLEKFAPDRYVLTVEARSRLGGATVKKDVEFWIK